MKPLQSSAEGAGTAAPQGVEGHPRTGLWALALGSVGVVFGDIGTSPLYAFREAVIAASGGPENDITTIAVLGVLSLILWALIVVVSMKYVLILLRADNNGEGGTLSLTALAFRAMGRRSAWVLGFGIVGAAMFYGDSVITPAISVLSAIEGLAVATPALGHWVIPLTVFVLVALFAVQSHGTGRVSAMFGPIMVVWFATLFVLGAVHIFDNPGVFAAVNPWYGISFLIQHKFIGLVTLGAVFLAVTGGEALYADLGHFGRAPIRLAWFAFVLPSLVVNYFGQGALVLAQPSAIQNPFYHLVPDALQLPMVVLATAATVIASQAVITGAYSLTRQAIQLGLLPRLEIRHTSAEFSGQIYIPRVNFALLAGVLLLVGLFRTSGNLASAYGVAVTTSMVVDGILGFVVIWKLWQWRWWSALLLMAPFVTIDSTFLMANLLKLLEGAWVPLLFGVGLVLIILTWRRGTRILMEKTRRTEIPLNDLVKSLEKKSPHIVKGTAIFLTANPDYAPTALLHNLKHNKVLHDQNIVLTITAADTPRVTPEERVVIEGVSPHFSVVKLKFGYMETPNVPKALAAARKLGWQFDIMSTSFYLSRRTLKPAVHSGMPRWQDHLYISLAQAANDATTYFQIPSERVVEIGTQVTV